MANFYVIESLSENTNYEINRATAECLTEQILTDAIYNLREHVFDAINENNTDFLNEKIESFISDLNILKTFDRNKINEYFGLECE